MNTEIETKISKIENIRKNNSKKFYIESEKPLIDVKLEKLISKGTITQQIQDEYKKSEQSLKSFIRENYLDLHND